MPSVVDATPAPDAEPAPVPLRINELLKNSPGADDDHEFVEVYGEPNTNLSDYSILVLESDLSANETIGVVDLIIPLSSTDGDGFFASAFFGDEFENGSISLILVRDLDAAVVVGTDLDADDDGEIDSPPWAELLDSVALIDDEGDIGYSEALLHNHVGGLAEEFVGASRLPDGMDTDTSQDWVRANDVGDGLEGLEGASGAVCDACGDTPAPAGRALITPGSANAIALGA
jgi:hypothetical protein